MDDGARSTAVDLVRRICGNEGTEEEFDELLHELERLVPDPRVSELIFWPSRHPLSQDLDPADLTAEVIVELAFRYEPFAL